MFLRTQELGFWYIPIQKRSKYDENKSVPSGKGSQISKISRLRRAGTHLSYVPKSFCFGLIVFINSDQNGIPHCKVAWHCAWNGLIFPVRFALRLHYVPKPAQSATVFFCFADALCTGFVSQFRQTGRKGMMCLESSEKCFHFWFRLVPMSASLGRRQLVQTAGSGLFQKRVKQRLFMSQKGLNSEPTCKGYIT